MPICGELADGLGKAFGALFAAFAAIVCCGCAEPVETQPHENWGMTVFTSEGVRNPAMHVASRCGLADDEVVIGVVVNGEARAYAVTAMSRMTAHLVKDVIGSTPVAVTYCDRNDCARVLGPGETARATDISVAGWKDGQMAIRLSDRVYVQSSREIPLRDVAFEKLDWQTWFERHPATRVYTGAELEN
jgi:hypothetical protein